MSVLPEVRNQIMAQAQGAMALYTAFVGLANLPRAHGAEWRAPEHRAREAQRAACRSAPGRRSRQALAAASAESEGP